MFVDQSLMSRWGLRIADVGSCDVNGTYRKLFERNDWQYVGFDMVQGPNVDVVLTPETLAEHAGQFDVVVSGQTLEHVPRPFQFVQQLASLLKPGGLLWVIAPNTFHFHEHPVDCWRVWPDGLRATFEDAGLDVVYCSKVGIDTFGLARKPV